MAMFPLFKDIKKKLGKMIGSGGITELSDEQVLETRGELEKTFFSMYRSSLAYAQNTARNELQLSQADIICRSSLATDYGLPTPEWSHTTIGGYDQGMNLLMDWYLEDNRFLIVWGIHLPKSTKITTLRVTSQGRDTRFFDIQHAVGDYFFDDPFLIRQNDRVTISAYFIKKTKEEKIKFYGTVVEPVGLKINP